MLPPATLVAARAAPLPAATAVLTSPHLRQRVTSFQHGIPAALLQLVRDFDAQAPDRIGLPYTRPNYAKMTTDRLMHMADAVGHAGDVGAVSIVLGMCTGGETDVAIACLALAALSNYQPAILEWLLDHQVDLLTVNFSLWVSPLLIRGETRLLSRVQERIGIGRLRLGLGICDFDHVARRGATDSLRWLHERGIRPSDLDAECSMLPLAIVHGHRSVVEFFLKTSRFQLSMLAPTVVAQALNEIVPSVESDRCMAQTFEWAVLEKDMRFDTELVRALVRLRCFQSARCLVWCIPPPRSTVLFDVPAVEELLRDGNMMGIRFALSHYDPAGVHNVAAALRRSPHSREAVLLVIDICKAFGERLQINENDLVFGDFVHGNESVFVV